MRTIHPNAEHFERPRTERIAALWVCRNRLEAVRQENAAADRLWPRHPFLSCHLKQSSSDLLVTPSVCFGSAYGGDQKPTFINFAQRRWIHSLCSSFLVVEHWADRLGRGPAFQALLAAWLTVGLLN